MEQLVCCVLSELRKGMDYGVWQIHRRRVETGLRAEAAITEGREREREREREKLRVQAFHALKKAISPKR